MYVQTIYKYVTLSLHYVKWREMQRDRERENEKARKWN